MGWMAKARGRGAARWGVICALALAAGCARNPVTGERELTLISESQEIQMGRQGAQQVERTMGLVQDPALQQYVDAIGQRLAAASERPELPWHFGVVDDPTPNAFALPGGFIYLTRGMMNLMDSESELAIVLGHEIGHVTARHAVSQLSRAQLAQLGLGLGTILFPQAGQAFGGLASAGLQLLFLKYGRDDERQSDELGFRYARQAGYDPSEGADIFVALQRIGEQEGGNGVPSWLSSHPAPEERIEAMRARVAELDLPDDAVRGRAEYLGHIDGLIYGENPRNGFFEGDWFLHPELRFRMAFPQQWTRHNMAQAVVGISSRQDALLQLTLAEAQGAASAAREFLAQQGVQAGGTTRTSVNGLPAVLAEFRAATEQGTLQGLAMFIEHGGRTYQVLGYTPAQLWGQYANLIRQSLGSFAPLTDPAALAVQPNRIDIVRVEQRMTLAEFQRRYPSIVPISELAIINQVQGAESVIPAGTLVKRVVEG